MRTSADSDKSVALGVARTGRVITAAALVMSISFAALFGAHVQFMRMLGLGLTLAVLVDATLVRMVLLPAFMHVLGRWNWWAPKPLVWLHDRIGLHEGEKKWAASPPRCRWRNRCRGVIPAWPPPRTGVRRSAPLVSCGIRPGLSRFRYSAAVRSRAPKLSIISRSTHFPGKSRLCLGMTIPMSNRVARVGGPLPRERCAGSGARPSRRASRE